LLHPLRADQESAGQNALWSGRTQAARAEARMGPKGIGSDRVNLPAPWFRARCRTTSR